MAETLTIEIPIEAVDRTSVGVESATRNLTAFERAWDRTQRRLERLERAHNIDIELDDNASQGLSRVSDQAESLDGVSPSVDVGVNNAATGTMSDVADQAATLDGTASDVDVGADDNASPIIDDVGDSLTTLNGNEAVVELTADDAATPTARAVEDSVEMIDGINATAELSADDNATPIVREAQDAVENFSGSSGSTQLGADDNASPVIASVRDQAAAWDGSVWTATVSIVDAATAPISKITGVLSNPLTQAGAMLGVTVGLNDTVNTYKSFESMMSQVQAISGATGSDLEALTAKAKEMGATTKFTATESAEAMNYMAMAGWKTSDMISGISGIMNLAAASGESLGSTSDIVTDALTAFGLKASDSTHFADVLAQASANANTNVGMLGESFKYVAPVAGAMNYSVEDTSLALGLMANASVKGSMAGTALKTALANMASPTDNMAAAMEKYGISLTDSEGNMKSLGDVLLNLRSSLGDLSETEQTAAASTIFGKEAMAGMLAIINASEEDYNKLSNAIYNADGAAQQMSETMLDNLEGSLTLMQSAVDGVKTSFGERLAPYIGGVADMITEAMPGAEQALSGLMDFVDGKAEGIKRTVGSMTNSEKWQNADLFGKVNIAWDTLIAEPFTKWVGSKGKHLMSKGLGTLFTEAAKIMPGGEKAGLTSWLSAGLIAKGATSLIGGASNVLKTLSPIGTAIKGIASAASEASSVGGFVSNLGSMIPMAGKVGLAAAAITAAVVAIGVAIDNYNQKVLSDNLAEHFGSIELTAKQAEEVASGILNAKYMTNVEMALNEFKGADQLRQKAEEALQANQALTWKSSVGIELTADEQQSYKDNITTFVESKISELESRTFAAHISVQTFLGGTEEGESLASSIEEWARIDHIDLSNLSEKLKAEVDNALTDGIIGVDEAKHIAELQNQINSITSKWKQAEAQAQLDWINQEYGSLSGKDLTADSFTSVVEALSEQLQLKHDELESVAKDFYTTLNAADAAGRLGKGGLKTEEEYKDLAGQAVRNQRAIDLMTSLDFEGNTAYDTYGSKIRENIAKQQSAAQTELEYAQYQLTGANATPGLFATNMERSMENFRASNGKNIIGQVNDADQNNLNEIVWASMKPDADAMTSLIDEYVNVGQDIPKQIKDKFNETMEMGAAAGDTDAAWQVYANSLAESGDKALIDAISNMDAEGGLPEEFSRAWKRALQGVTDEPLTLEGLQAEIKDLEVENPDVLAEKLKDALNTGDQVAVDGTDLTITLGEVSVDQGDALSKIAEAVGMTVEELKTYNGLSSDAEVDLGATIRIPQDRINVDTGNLVDAVNQATSEASSIESAEIDAMADVTLQAGSTDTTPVEQAAQAALSGETSTTDTTMTTDITVEAGSMDATPAATSAQAELNDTFSNSMQTNGSTDVTIEKASDNIAAVYSQVGSELQAAFNSPYSARASVNVTVDYHITNPTASLSTSSSGSTVSVSIAGHANGGEVGLHGAELSWLGEEGKEYVIPTVPGRRGRGIALWQQAGIDLGVLDSSGEIAAHANGGIVGTGGEELASNTILPLTAQPQEENKSVWSVTGQELTGDSSEEESEGKKTVSVNAAVQGQQSNNTFEINVDMSPVIKIDGGNMDEEKVFEVMKNRIREMADDLGDEIAERMSKIFANMPLIQEA